MSDWWSSITSTAKHFADEIAETIVAQANAAENILNEEQNKIKKENEQKSKTEVYELPWTAGDEAHSILTDPLMEQILSLPLYEANFLQDPPPQILSLFNFDFQNHVNQILKLLSIDQNLARVHSKFSPKMDEVIFWRNYFIRVYYLRAKVGIDGVEAQEAVSNLPFDNLFIGKPTKEPSNAVSEMAPVASKPTESPPLSTTNVNHSQEWDGSDPTDSSLSLNDNVISMSETDESDIRKRLAAEEAALAAEVAAELENDNLEIDLGDLDQMLIDEGFEELQIPVDVLGNDDELEAQIAKELNLAL